MCLIDFSDFYDKDQIKNQSKFRKNQKEQKWVKGKKILQYLVILQSRERKESAEIQEHKQETDSSRPTCSTYVSQSVEFDSAEERINLD